MPVSRKNAGKPETPRFVIDRLGTTFWRRRILACASPALRLTGQSAAIYLVSTARDLKADEDA